MSALWSYLRVRKRFWLLPAILVAMMLLALLLVGNDSGDDFVYTMF